MPLDKLDEILAVANQSAVELQQAISNYRKSPKDRLSERYITEYISKIDAVWTKFQQYDHKLRCDLPPDHNYFQKDVYAQLGAKYNDNRSMMIAELASAKEKALQGIPDKAAPAATQRQNIDADTSRAACDDRRDIKSNNESPVEYIRQQKLLENIHTLIQEALTSRMRSSHYYAAKLQIIEQHWKSVNILHERLLVSATEYNLDEFFRIEGEINEGILELQELIRNSTTPINEFTTGLSQRMVKLPAIEIPKFNGTSLRWRQFRDLFMELVHRQAIPNCQKMWYLKTSLTGEAALLVNHLSATAENYDAAWQILEDRYENKRVLINAVLSRLLSQQGIVLENVASIKSLHDTTQECLMSLKNLNIDTHSWDPLLMYLLTQKLSKNIHTQWEQTLIDPKKLPSIEELLNFLRLRFQSLESVASRPVKIISDPGKPSGTYKALSITAKQYGCIICKQPHAIYRCTEFIKLTPQQRLAIIQRAKNCVNCLRQGHTSKTCKSGSCSKCQKKHNTLLHIEQPETPGPAMKSGLTSEVEPHQPPVTATAVQNTIPYRTAVLSTVLLSIIDKAGNPVPCRALLDSGSQVNLITKRCVSRIGLAKNVGSLEIEGIGNTQRIAAGRVNVEIASKTTSFALRIEAHILPTIVSTQPRQRLDTHQWNIPKNVPLADPRFCEPGEIDLLLGAGVFFSILSIGQIKLGDGLPRLQNSLFGWLVGGDLSVNASSKMVCGICTEDIDLNHTLEKFWQMEEGTPHERTFTSAEQRCESYYVANTRRSADGRYVVRLPYQLDKDRLGDSREIAYRRFKAVEGKLNRNPELKAQYVKFMREYEELGHMEKLTNKNVSKPHYFLPHHAVLKPDSTTTKLRVVFDASAKTSTNVALNDILDKGPTIQDDMFTILMRFRLPRYVFTADIEKMYRQIWVDERDRNMQLIFWREDESKPVDCFKLNTITYGTSSAPYLAIRTLRTLAKDCKAKYPLAASAIKNNFYVDDVLGGDDSLAVALETQDQLMKALKASGFNLRKWCANHPRLLDRISKADREIELTLNKAEETIKTMGLIWHPTSDVFAIKIAEVDNAKITKRSILSETAHIFDPLGFLAPVTVTAKIIIQKLWQLKLDWDAALPQDLHQFWINFKHELHMLQTLKVPRHIFAHRTPVNPQLHIFTDASERAYGAVAYVRIKEPSSVTIRLVAAKSRVAPVKNITLPRLELCAAKLGTELLQRLQEVEAFRHFEVFCWSDSTAVLGWINAASSNYHTFIANRIAAIQQVTSSRHWRHVRSEDNPADLISRGLTPSKIIDNNFWFYGPKFLHGSISCWPLQPPRQNCPLELKKGAATVTNAVITKCVLEEINHKNSFHHLRKVIACMLKFSARLRGRDNLQEEAFFTIIKVIQLGSFATEIKAIKGSKVINNDSSISSLTPFLDQDGLLRVGGRLEASQLDYDAKHPIILPCQHPVTRLIIETIHKDNLHAGQQTVMAIVRQRFWPLKLKMITRSIIQNCVQCARTKPKLMQQLMGNLPADRVQPARPFVISGVDFFGPVWTHVKIRGKRPLKAYVAVFCCFSTKAVHMEVVNDLSTNGFINALNRFIGRRGHCKKLYCDNATNFVGAKTIIGELQHVIHDKKASEKILETCNKNNIEFIFIPPRAPHFGGLWEAAVKSAKKLLQGILSSASLTYEEMETVIIQAEAIMNSRPLTEMSSDPNSLQALTPGHFLIGEPLTNTIDFRAQENHANNRQRWKVICQLKEEFWRRWSNEYLCGLQHRYKWKQEGKNATPGTMVIIKDDNLPSLKWPMGRIEKVIQGEDGLVRVADVRTSKGILRRPIHKLAPLPVSEEQPTSESNQDLGDETPIKKKRKTCNLMPLTIAMMCLILPLCLASSIEVQKFRSPPGIYFEKLGSCGIISSEWDLVIYVDMQSYWKKFETVNIYSTMLRELCKANKTPSNCITTAKHIENLTGEISMKNKILKGHNNARIKRGALDVVGNVAHALFGVLDSEYAVQAEKKLEAIRENEVYIEAQLQNHTSFLDSTLNIVKHSQMITNSEITELKRILNNVLTNQQKGSTLHTTIEVAQMAMLDLLHLERIQDSLLDILVNVHHGTISPELISPQQLQEELKNVKLNLKGLRLPAKIDDLVSFYKLMTIEGRMTQKYAIFRVNIPLLMTEEFELLQLTPVPWHTVKGFFLINTPNHYMIVDLHRDQYMPIGNTEINQCISVNTDSYICQHTHPLYKADSNEGPVCEISLLKHRMEHSACEVKGVNDGPHWKRLSDQNHWLYSVAGEYNLDAACNDIPERITIQGAGLIILKENCQIKQQTITIQGHKRFETINHKFYLPSVNISQIEAHYEKSINLINHTSEVLAMQKTISDLQYKLMDTQVKLPNKLRPHDIHHYTISYVTLALVIGGLAALLWKWRQRKIVSDIKVSHPNIGTNDGEEMITIHG